eukprot:jgi/Tetstr1/438182/TSEL_026782.t1
MSRLLLRMKDALMAESHRSTDKGLNKFEVENTASRQRGINVTTGDWSTEVIGATVRKARTRNAKKGPKARRDVHATTPPKPCPGRSHGPTPEEAPTKDKIGAGWTATEVAAKPSVGVQEREEKAIKASSRPASRGAAGPGPAMGPEDGEGHEL